MVNRLILTGTFKRSIDESLRMAIPKRFRDTITRSENGTSDDESTQLYISPGTDGSLTLYTEASFTRIADQLDQMPSTGKEVRAFSRLFFSRSENLEIDKQGRIRIPASLAELAEIKPGEAMLIGVRDRMEIWNTDRWKKYIAGTETEYDQLAEEALKSKG